MEIAGQNAELPEIRRRIRVLGVFVVLVFLALLGRLFYLQIVEGDTYYRVTSDSIVRTGTLPALRGEIRDRKGRTLATTRPSYAVNITPTQIHAETYQALKALLGERPEPLPDWSEIAAKARAAATPTGGTTPAERAVVLAEDVPREIMAAIETQLEAPGVRVVPSARRHYPNGALAAHALGYMNEISAEELNAAKDGIYRPGDVLGRTGLERQWEPYLRGQKGFEKTVVDRRGLRRADVNIADLVEGDVRQEPIAGQNLVLTIDADVQRVAERALRIHPAAAAVVLDVQTGRVLALASRPGFDPNEMSGRLSPDIAARIFSDPHRPFRDKTLSETYNPGSAFKVVSALAALEDRVIAPDERVKCGGFVQIGRRRFRCTKAHGPVNLHGALVQSCNVFFYDLATRPGMMNRLAKYANLLGLGAPTGLGLNGEQPGFVPTEEWHREQQAKDPKSEGFVIGNVLNTAIGEGATRATVLQMALIYAAIATEGKLWLPQIVERIEGGNGEILEEFPPRVRRHISIPPETLTVLRRALVGVVNDPKGTAWKARSKRVTVAGKTGTAHAQAHTYHAWFAGYAPADNPRVAFAVLVEQGGHGGEVAAPIAMEIVENTFDLFAKDTVGAATPPLIRPAPPRSP